MPYGIAVEVEKFEQEGALRRIHAAIIVDKPAYKAIVIGKGGELLKRVGSEVRRQMPPGAHLELHVTVDKDWQQRADRLERLGY